MKPKILVFTSTFPRWQNDTDPPFVYELCKRLTDEFDVHVLTPHYLGAKCEDNFSEIKVKRYRYFFTRFEKLAGSVGILPTLKTNKLYFFIIPFFLMAGLFAMFSYSRKVKPDIIHAHWAIPQGFIVWINSFFYNKPYIITVHGADVFGLKGSLFDFLRYVVLRKARAVIAVSEALKKGIEFKNTTKCNIEVLPMGVDSDLFKSSGESKYRIFESQGKAVHRLIYVGRLTEKKGVEYLLESIRLLKDDGFSIHLTIIGAGERLTDLKGKATDLKIDEMVTFKGAIPNNLLGREYISHSIFIGPSIETVRGDTEGFGLTFVEAAMAGCLLIGTEVGGIPDIIQDNITGYLVEQKNSQAIADRVRFVISNYLNMDKIVNQGKRRCIRKYDWMVISGAYKKIFNEVHR